MSGCRVPRMSWLGLKIAKFGFFPGVLFLVPKSGIRWKSFLWLKILLGLLARPSGHHGEVLWKVELIGSFHSLLARVIAMLALKKQGRKKEAEAQSEVYYTTMPKLSWPCLCLWLMVCLSVGFFLWSDSLFAPATAMQCVFTQMTLQYAVSYLVVHENSIVECRALML